VRVLLIATILAALSVPARSECLSSASAVWAVHPGSHPNWRLRMPSHVGEKCWYAKIQPTSQRRRFKRGGFKILRAERSLTRERMVRQNG